MIRTATIYSCAALGGLIATLADIVQKEEASAVVKITSLSARYLQIGVPPLSVLLLLVVLAAALCFVFQPENRRASFTVGLGIIAVIMTLTPYNQPPTGSAALDVYHRQYAALATPGHDGILWLAQRTVAAGEASLSFNVQNPFAKPLEVTISVYNDERKQEFRQRRSIGRTGSFHFMLPAGANPAAIHYEVEVEHLRTSMSSLRNAAPAGLAGGEASIALDLADELAKAGRPRQAVAAAIAECGEIECGARGTKQFLQQLLQPKRW